MVSYPMDTEGHARAMEAAFPQLYYRMEQLEEQLISHFLRGSAQCLVAYGHKVSSAPYFSAVSFEEGEAEKYEARMRKFFSTYKNKRSSVLPRPDFAVRIEVDLGGGNRVMFDFSFAGYCDETVLAFCEAVEMRAAELFRHRFSDIKRQMG